MSLLPFLSVFPLYEEYVVRSFPPDGVFLPCGQGLDFEHSNDDRGGQGMGIICPLSGGVSQKKASPGEIFLTNHSRNESSLVQACPSGNKEIFYPTPPRGSVSRISHATRDIFLPLSLLPPVVVLLTCFIPSLFGISLCENSNNQSSRKSYAPVTFIAEK